MVNVENNNRNALLCFIGAKASGTVSLIALFTKHPQLAAVLLVSAFGMLISSVGTCVRTMTSDEYRNDEEKTPC